MCLIVAVVPGSPSSGHSTAVLERHCHLQAWSFDNPSTDRETSSNRDRSPLHEALPLTPSTPSYFGGYGPQREQVWALVRLGLGLDVDGKSPPPSSGLPGSMFTPPKGLLLYGPRGTGKTLLMQEVAAQLGAECHVLHVSHDILLSK